MVCFGKWMSSMSLGLAVLAWQGLPAQAQLSFPSDDRPVPIRLDSDDDSDDQPEAPVEPSDDTPQDSDSQGDSAPTDSGDSDPTDSNPSTPADSDSDYRPQSQNDSDASDEPDTEIIKERYPNGAVRVEREVTQDIHGNYVNHGAWKMYDQRGALLAQGEYINGNRTGTWIRWYRSVGDAKLLTQVPYRQFAVPFISQATFKEGQLDGAWTIYDGKKQKVHQLEFRDGRRHGTAIWWHTNGKKMKEVHYRDGDVDGLWLEWHPEGSPSVKDTYQAGRKLATKTSQFNGGAKKSEGTYLFAKEMEQSADDWWECKLQVVIKQGHDEKHGPWVSYHGNGQRQLSGTYDHDVQDGQFTWWHANGQKALEGSYSKGKQDGPWVWWYPSGQKSIQGGYALGNPTGRWTWWKEDGKVAQSADLSHSEGVVIDMPAVPKPGAASQARQAKPASPSQARQPKPQARPTR